jgi:prephenate dehydratase
MKKTYVTSMPNHIGSFLKASKCFAALGINITRVSYDKSVDSHMLFLDVEGTEEQIRKADAELEKIGYLRSNSADSSIVLIEFCLADIPGSVTRVLELINRFNFNISYINSQENGTDYQYFKMGLHVENLSRFECRGFPGRRTVKIAAQFALRAQLRRENTGQHGVTIAVSL